MSCDAAEPRGKPVPPTRHVSLAGTATFEGLTAELMISACRVAGVTADQVEGCDVVIRLENDDEAFRMTASEQEAIADDSTVSQGDLIGFLEDGTPVEELAERMAPAEEDVEISSGHAGVLSVSFGPSEEPDAFRIQTGPMTIVIDHVDVVPQP